MFSSFGLGYLQRTLETLRHGDERRGICVAHGFELFANPVPLGLEAVEALAVRGLLRYISRHDFTVFAWYRIAFGLIVLVTAYSGTVSWSAA